MFFNLKSIVLYGLLAVATASPILSTPDPRDTTTVQLEARTKSRKVTQSFTLLDGGIISKESIAKALGELRNARPKPENEWPVGMKHFGNKKSTTGPAVKVFPDKPIGDDSGLLEFRVPLPGERGPGSLRLVATSGATPNLVGMMQHPAHSSTAFQKLEPVPEPAPEKECEPEPSTSTKPATRDVWEFVKRTVTGTKAKPAGKACPLKDKCTPAMKKAGKCKATTSHKKPTHKKTGHKKQGHKTSTHQKHTHKTPTHTSRKGGKKGH